MKATARRGKIVQILSQRKDPLSARKLADQFEVSRQVIVGDVALLRAEGHEIIATPRGYLYGVLQIKEGNHYTGKIVCQHHAEQAEQELRIIVNNGGEVLDVEVEHSFYGIITGKLQIQSTKDVDEFLLEMQKENSKMLSSLTDGIHLHTIRCADERIFQKIKQELKEAGILYQ